MGDFLHASSAGWRLGMVCSSMFETATALWLLLWCIFMRLAPGPAHAHSSFACVLVRQCCYLTFFGRQTSRYIADSSMEGTQGSNAPTHSYPANIPSFSCSKRLNNATRTLSGPVLHTHRPHATHMQVISTIESYVVDSLQYLQGLMPSYDLLACMREQRDRFMTRLLVDLYLIHAQNLLRDGSHVQSFILVR